MQAFLIPLSMNTKITAINFYDSYAINLSAYDFKQLGEMPLTLERHRAAIVQLREPVPPRSDIHIPRESRILWLQKEMEGREDRQSEDEKDKPINKSEVTSKMT